MKIQECTANTKPFSFSSYDFFYHDHLMQIFLKANLQSFIREVLPLSYLFLR